MRAPTRSTCASRRRRSGTPATTGSTCRRARRWSPTSAPRTRSRPSWAATRCATCRSAGSTRRSAPPARHTATPASRATTRSPEPSRPTGSSRSKSWLSCVRNNSATRPFRPAARGATLAVPLMELDGALHEYFGFDAFRPGQREACSAALADRDVLVVMPTGSGKSLCYQLPALLRDDLTVVVSPLVALMQDQVEALAARGLGDRVALVNAQQDRGANDSAIQRAVSGNLDLLYVAPERFAAARFLDEMREADVGLFVVDEAHCVSQWGHDFRPDYFRLADAARKLDASALIASTATATPRVAADVIRRLALREPLRVSTGFDRPNISFTVARPGGHVKRAMLAEALRGEDALPAIVYAGTRAGAEEIAAELTTALGEEAVAYHAGLDRERRADVQR